MFSFLRNHSANLDQSQRFYYDNYDYFNIYENLQREYKDDLSKFIYHCNRRNTPLIITYGASPSQIRLEHDRALRDSNSTNMEQFINSFLPIIMENNYFNAQRQYERADHQVDPFQLMTFSKINEKIYNDAKMILLSYQELLDQIQKIITVSESKVSELEQAYENENHSGVFNLECNVAFEMYLSTILSSHYMSDQSLNFLLLYEFVVDVHRLLWRILTSKMRTILLLAQPYTPFLNYMVHPLIIPISTFLKYNHSSNPNEKLMSSVPNNQIPRIVLLNLDGKQNAQNIRNICALESHMLYISLYNQPSWLTRTETIIENTFNSYEEEVKVTYSKLCEVYSELIINQFRRAQHPSENAPKILLFPLNSDYIQNQYLKKCYCAKPQKTGKNIPKIQSSQDIHFLFEQIIFQEIRQFKPTIIFVSYNGELNLLEDHFSDIIRNCSIMADHRVILFTNFTHLFDNGETKIDEDSDDKVKCANEFYEKYFHYGFAEINQERFFSNISAFLKYGPGFYSMQSRQFGSQSSKYGIGNRYHYLQFLQSLDEFSFVQKYCLQKWKSSELSKLFSQFGEWEIRENKKENEYYDKLITTVISEFLCRNINEMKLQEILDRRLVYRLKFIIKELVKEHEYQKKIHASLFEMGEMEEIGQEINWMELLEKYLEEMKAAMLLENMENYKIKKHYHLAQSQRSFGHVTCFKFVMGQERESEQLYLEKYSQIIINENREQLFILNYRALDNRHLILSGSIKNLQMESSIIVNQVKQTERQLSEQFNYEFEHHYLTEEGIIAQNQDIVYAQYNHCFMKGVVYLFWPLMWNLKEEVRCKLLGIEYRPKRVFKMIRIAANVFEGHKQFRYENILYRSDPTAIEVMPRWGCTSYSINQNKFLILGGIFDNQNDFKVISSGISVAQIEQSNQISYFTIKGEPKRKHELFACLKPKINYCLRDDDEMMEEKSIRLYRGYGRQNTSCFNLFSYEQYEICLKQYVPRRLLESKISRRVVTTEKPLSIYKIGKFNVIGSNSSFSQVEEKFSDLIKQKFVFQKKNEGVNKGAEWQIFVFIDENYRINEFKTDPKKMFLFGFNRTVREKIFSRCWSPQLYIVDGVKEDIANLSLKTEKTSSYMLANYLMPREEDIVSLCLEQDRIFLLSNSPIIHSIERPGLKFVLYEGLLTNMNEVIRKRQVQMSIRYAFNNQSCEKYLNQKTIFIEDEKILLVGGSSAQNEKPTYEREDYILERMKNKYKVKIKKLEGSEPGENLDMPNSVVVVDQENESYYLYSITYQDGMGLMSEDTEMWRIKIEKHALDVTNNEDGEVRMGEFKTYFYNLQEEQVERYPRSHLEEPKFVKITPYERFHLPKLREAISKVIWRMDKNQLQRFQVLSQKSRDCLQIIKNFQFLPSQQILKKQLFNTRGEVFQFLIEQIQQKSERSIEANFGEQQLLKDLKLCYTLVSKMILEGNLYISEIPPKEKQYKFIVEDKSSRRVKYIAIGLLNTTQLNFFRIRYRNELFLCLNQDNDEGLFFSPKTLACQKFQYQKMKKQSTALYSGEEVVKPIKVLLKQ